MCHAGSWLRQGRRWRRTSERFGAYACIENGDERGAQEQGPHQRVGLEQDLRPAVTQRDRPEKQDRNIQLTFQHRACRVTCAPG